ncbi:hypothetical protein GCM10010441_74130 [Kitasatospora paracochleata]
MRAMDLSELQADDRPPTPVGPADWAAAEAWLGLRLPGDFKALLADHGPVLVGGRIEIEAPIAGTDRLDYAAWIRDLKHESRRASRELPPHRPPAFHPAPGGLLPWGSSNGGGLSLFWDTSVSDDPDRWTVVLCEQLCHRCPEQVSPWLSYDLTVSAFLETVLLDCLPLPGGGVLGPLPLTVHHRGAPEAGPWTAPPVRQLSTEERETALRTGTGVDALGLLAPPPTVPYLGEDLTWERLFEQLGTRLPSDWLVLMRRYGAGCWGEWASFNPPLAEGERGLLGLVRWRTSTYREHRARFPDRHPLAVWPEPGGFLPFATTIDNDALGWLTAGDPDSWPVVVQPRHAEQGPPLEGSSTEILLEWTRGRLDVEGLPGLDPDDDPFDFAEFEPWAVPPGR